MKTIVITGSTRGIGFGLAEAFLQRDCQVMICGRSTASVEEALKKLSEHYPAERIHGLPCDVSDYAQVQALWEAARTHFGQVDIWINNAAVSNRSEPFWEQSPDAIRAVVSINLIGTLNGCQVAIKGMIAQGSGHIYNMEGYGSGGEIMSGGLPYGITKYALPYLTKALNREIRGLPVKISNISPGMVTTDLLLGTVEEDRKERAKRIFNILADRVDTVTPWLADRILENQKSGTRIAWLTQPKIWTRFLLAPFRKRDLFSEET